MNIVDVLLRRRVILFLPLTIFGQMAPPFALETEFLFHQGGSLFCCHCYNFSYFALFTYDFSLFLEVSHGAAALTHFSLTHITATLLTHCTAIVLTHSIAILIALPHWCSIYSGQSCRLFFS